MDILNRLNSGELHAAARNRRPECADAKGNIHTSPERARFVDWLDETRAIYGQDVKAWPPTPRAEYESRYVPSH